MNEETLRMKVRDAIGEQLKEAGISSLDELEYQIADAVFDALEISESEQDEYSKVRPVGDGNRS